MTHDPPDPTPAEILRHQYAVCGQRGHQPSDTRLMTYPARLQCKWCRTVYWDEVIQHEQGAPC